MENNFGSITGSHVLVRKGEFMCFGCLAIIGIVTIIGKIAAAAYQLGKDTKEVEMERELKKCMKKLKKEKREL